MRSPLGGRARQLSQCTVVPLTLIGQPPPKPTKPMPPATPPNSDCLGWRGGLTGNASVERASWGGHTTAHGAGRRRGGGTCVMHGVHGQRCVDSKNSQTTPATTSTSSIRQLLGAADTQTAHHATFNTPTTGLRERGNDTSRSTGRSGRQKVATPRNMRREERVTVQGPVKEQQPDGMSHRGTCVMHGRLIDTHSLLGGRCGFCGGSRVLVTVPAVPVTNKKETWCQLDTMFSGGAVQPAACHCRAERRPWYH